jgi:hypothetical protein
VVADEVYDVGVRTSRDVAGEGEFGDQSAECDLPLSIDVRDRVHEEVVPANLHLVSFVPQMFEVGATIYQWL